MQKYIIGENGIGYILGEDGLYYPDLRLPESTHYSIGKYGRMRLQYLKDFRQMFYMELLLNGGLNEHLHQIDKECYEMMERLIGQMKEKQGVTETLKKEQPMVWVGMMNDIRNCAEEVVLRDIVYV